MGHEQVCTLVLSCLDPDTCPGIIRWLDVIGRTRSRSSYACPSRSHSKRSTPAFGTLAASSNASEVLLKPSSPQSWPPVSRNANGRCDEAQHQVVQVRVDAVALRSWESPAAPTLPKAPTSSTTQPQLDLLRGMPTVTAVAKFKSTPWLFDGSTCGDPCRSSSSNPYSYFSRTDQDDDYDCSSLVHDTADTESSRSFTEDGVHQYAVLGDSGRLGLEPGSPSSGRGPGPQPVAAPDGKDEHRQDDDLGSSSSVASSVAAGAADVRPHRGPRPDRGAALPTAPRRSLCEDGGHQYAIGDDVDGPSLYHASSSSCRGSFLKSATTVEGKIEHRQQRLQGDDLKSSLSVASPTAAGAGDVRLHRRLGPGDAVDPVGLRRTVCEDGGRQYVVGGNVDGGAGLYHASSSSCRGPGSQAAVDGKEEHRPQHLQAEDLGFSLSVASPVATGAADVRPNGGLNPGTLHCPPDDGVVNRFSGSHYVGRMSARSAAATRKPDRRAGQAPVDSSPEFRGRPRRIGRERHSRRPWGTTGPALL